MALEIDLNINAIPVKWPYGRCFFEEVIDVLAGNARNPGTTWFVLGGA
jgi:hypothetical protein